MSATREIAAPGYAAARWKALGSYVSLVVADQERLPAARMACAQLLEEIDLSCSRFRGDSDLVRANRGAGGWVPVAPLLIRAITEAVRVAEITDGLVDPTLGGQLVALGYDRDLAEVQASPDTGPGGGTGTGPLGGTPVTPEGWRLIEIDPDGALRVPTGVSLDIGATGKAFAADLIASTVPRLAGTALIISLGGDVAIGDRPGEAGHLWRISVAERPEDADLPGAEVVVLTEGGLATSSTLARRWRQSGHPVHHLLDPRTGLPVDAVWRTASVCANSCLDANAASTAAIVLGAAAPGWLREHDLAARLVGADGRVARIAGWPDPVAEPASEPSASGAPS
jgi:thiamine biosynthesis lipoprotein